MHSKKLLFFMLGLVGIVASQTPVRAAASLELNAMEMRGMFKCPAPSEVKCKSFAESVGNWTQNGGYRSSANTAFMPNNQCANVIKINENGFNNRLLCCYNVCGVLTMDVKFHDCKKTSTSEFACQ